MLVSKKHRALVLNLREPDRVLTVIPSAKALQYKDKTLVAVPHKIDEVRVLRNLGMDAPAPINHYYEWPGKNPFIHQRISSEFMTMNPRMFCLNGMGSGKTLSTLWAYDFLRQVGEVRKMLVISPLSTLERAWGDEIVINFPHLNFAVLHGDRKKRHKLLAAEFDIYIINHDGIKAHETLELLAKREGIDLIVVDEIATFRNVATTRWKALNMLVNGSKKLGWEPKKWAWGLTGTPTPNEPTDAYGQCKIINPGRVPTYAGKFRDSVMRQMGPFRWAARENAVDVVREAMQPSVRFAREDCIDLPPTTFVTRETTLTSDQLKAFHEMMRQFKTEHEGGQISAVNAAVKLGKLLQICCGVAYGVNGEVNIPATPRIELVKEIIEEAEAKVLVFVPLTAPLLALAAELRKDYTVAVVHGETSRTERDKIFREFQQSPNPRVLVANPGTLSHGLTLTAANTIVWFAPIFSNETYQQANARVTRPGQTLNTLIVNIEATAVERKVYASLQGRQNAQALLLDILKG
jgi:superfamily II DNA or RNA helicase